jgi:hypothetical protein
MNYKEEWRSIENYPSYQISNYGRVKNQFGRILKPYPNRTKKAYFKVELSDGIHSEQIYVHKLVASHFLRKPKHNEEINHLDNNPKHNWVSNLEWLTHKENMAYKLVCKFFTFDTMPDGLIAMSA